MDRVVLPALGGATGVKLLRGLAERWENHKLMVRWMKRVFNYLDRYYVQRHNLHCMNDVGLMVWKGECVCACIFFGRGEESWPGPCGLGHVWEGAEAPNIGAETQQLPPPPL